MPLQNADLIRPGSVELTPEGLMLVTGFEPTRVEAMHLYLTMLGRELKQRMQLEAGTSPTLVWDGTRWLIASCDSSVAAETMQARTPRKVTVRPPT